MSTHGAITAAIQHVRDSLEAVLSPYKWALLTAENPFQKWNILAATRSTGFCVVSWKSDAPLAQSSQSLVIRAKLAITICARMDFADVATGKLRQPSGGTGPALFEIHDRVKGKMLSLSMPAAGRPQAQSEFLIYGGSVPLTTPDGFPLDAIEQTWDVELFESFGP